MSPTFNTRAAWKVIKPSAVPRSNKSRRGPKARSWTEQEERYLLNSRECRLPYRRIASHLNKTELACRLHYHQLTVVKARQAEDGYNPSMRLPATPASPCEVRSPETTHTQIHISVSPEIEYRTLPSLRRWLDESSYHCRSTSLPTPTPSRPGSSQSITAQRNPYQALTPPTPPTPPQTHHLSPRTLPRAGLGVMAIPVHHRAISYPPPAISGLPYLPPMPQPHLGAASHWTQPTSRRFPPSHSGEWEIGAPLQNYDSAAASLKKASAASSSIDRCSVQSLLNHE